jgi:outer membrane protein OmpA-like peptidoglycan-associated protein
MMSRRPRSAALLPLLLLGAAAEAAEADGTVDFELFAPHADTTGYLHSGGASTLRHLQLGLSLWGGYENDPVVLQANGERVRPQGGAEDERGDAIVDGRLRTHLGLAMGIGGFSSLAIDVPLTLSQQGTTLDSVGGEAQSLRATGLNDIVVTPKLIALNPEDFPVGLAVSLPLSLPTGAGESFLGDGSLGFSPSATLELADDSVQDRQHGLRAAVSAGYAVRGEDRLRDLHVGGAMTWGAAGGWRPADPIELVAEVHGELGGGRVAQSPAELLAGLRIYAGDMVTLNLGGGAGLAGFGAPDWRGVFGLTVAPDFDPNAKDSDLDGINDGIDGCVTSAEDKDGYQDSDGCPDKDNDVDKIPDERDQCADDPEDDDGFQDTDGCPDKDNDGDGVVDVEDRCPNESEVANGYQDDDGCPDSRPRADQDNDRIPDDVDRCPAVAEDFNGNEDGDGCPDGRVQVQGEAIKITEKIYFDTGKDSIQARSHDLLDEIAKVLVEHPELKLVRIEGHTDNVGPDANNLKLSGARAEAVRRYLVGKGVAVERLEARGFGEMYPLQSNDTEPGRAANRRVEFIIVERG